MKSSPSLGNSVLIRVVPQAALPIGKLRRSGADSAVFGLSAFTANGEAGLPRVAISIPTDQSFASGIERRPSSVTFRAN